ncbi:type I restriction enzyme M protein [Butyrivibrio proteoclasticus]|uniref:Type I restriction enzyme M protein n=1 Tax=Butyrivibrio proteoclasticus TaxID=43305 RepID=A0A1I5VHA2_9FIRM|nr:N-6 DNA methylase [Butyrivibrio proteoclasticus]SFQ06924.1 type I restriction enzyme M protein [Butyrivibrio proteoclasticus]
MLDRNEIRKIDAKVVSEISWKIANFMRGMAPADPKQNFVLVYLAFVALTNEIDNIDDLLFFIEDKISEQRAMFAKEVARDSIEIALQLSKTFSEEDLLAYLFVFPREYSGRFGGEYGTPESLSKLAVRVLDIKENERVADFGSGAGDFITLATEGHEINPFYGIELNTYSYEISKIRAELFADNTEFELGDMFAVSMDKKFEKIFSNYPFGMRLIHLQTGSAYIEDLLKRMPEIKRATSSDWIFNSVIFDHLTENGKAVAIMTNGSTWNSIDQRIREYFIRNGYVEAVISLPAKLFEFTNIATTMIVLSRGNKEVRLVDATALCEQGRRQNVITDENIEHIISLLKEDGDETITVDLKTLQNNEFVLNPSRYLEKTIEIEDGVELGSLMKRITRGAPLRASELDEMVSDEPTDTQYLMLANIQNGMISEDLPYLKELDAKLDKYCIGNRNLLLSKNGAPFKVAVAEVEEGRKILGNGNLFIIELDEEKVNPYFIKAFFDSEVGTAVLKSIAVGATIPNISAESLKKLIVPLPSMEKQNEIANLYQAKQDEIKVLQLKIQKAQNDLRGIFGEVK